jgi:dihydroorotase-like cyclic amidohydrolase
MKKGKKIRFIPMKTIIRNACIVNEGNRYVADILISNERIAINAIF